MLLRAMSTGPEPHFQEALTDWAEPFARPVYFGRRHPNSNKLEIANGTGGLLRLGDKFLGVTCQHVIKQYRAARLGGRADFFYFGDAPIDPEASVIDESERLDLVVFDLTQVATRTPLLRESNFYEPRHWPPADVAESDVLAFVGFPGEWREQEGRLDLYFHKINYGAASIESVSEDRICSRLALDEVTYFVRNKTGFESAGGLSGAPVFVWRRGVLLTGELVGFVYEHQAAFDLLFIRRATSIQASGKLNK
jgi:hypothetical protein